MAADPLEEKINKIRQQNEEIRRRYEEVEADKKKAAKSNSLVQMVPSADWPERKEPPEFSSPPLPKIHPKPRNLRDNGASIQYRAGGEGKKMHTFSQSEGPPPDPKYNFLADSEREEHRENLPREIDKSKNRGQSRPHFKRRWSNRDWQAKDHRGKSGPSGQDSLPDYEAWRAERNKIDEARISRQRTAEGNWKREWDNDKIHLADDSRRDDTLGDALRHEGEGDRHRGFPRNSSYSHGRDAEHERSDKNSVVSPNSKNPLMSVKVSSSNIVGTGRVGPRQRTRVMYSSQSESMNFEVGNFTVPKSPEEKSKSSNFGNAIKSSKSFNSHRRNDSDKSPHPLRREHDKDFRNFQKSPHVQRRNTFTNFQSKSPGAPRKFGSSWEESGMLRSTSEINKKISPINVASVSETENVGKNRNYNKVVISKEEIIIDNEIIIPKELIIIDNQVIIPKEDIIEKIEKPVEIAFQNSSEESSNCIKINQEILIKSEEIKTEDNPILVIDNFNTSEEIASAEVNTL